MSEMRELQTTLKNAGFDPGPLDGVCGPRTLTALRAFLGQESRESITALLHRILEERVRRLEEVSLATGIILRKLKGGFGTGNLPAWLTEDLRRLEKALAELEKPLP